MKILRNLLVVAICVLALGILFTKSGTTHTTQKAQAASCTVSQVGSSVVIQDPNASFMIFLMYSPCESQNFAVVQVSPTGVPAPVVSVQRATGPDGSEKIVQQNCSVSTTEYCGSPGVYSPTNLSRACVSDANDSAMPRTCTSWY